MSANQVFAMEVQGFNPYTNEPAPGKKFDVPVFSCGHCSATVVMRPDRTRPRVTCLACGRWICEKHELCMQDCTPLYSLADDKFEAKPSRWTKWLNAIMGGAQTVDEAAAKQLIKE